jgi:monovalent cation/hydrogen antiporter
MQGVHETELLLLGLFVAVPALSVLARFLDVPYPILLVIGGLAIGLLPGLPDVELHPDLVLVLFLPPLLYVAAFFSNLRDFRADLRPISLMAIGLVLCTACIVAVAAHELIGGLSWGAAFALGAIVSPTDPLAATTIARRLGAPRRVVTIVEGESLVNDGTALVIYKVAVAAAVGGSFSVASAGLDFVVSVAGGVLVGLVVGYGVAEVRKRVEDPLSEITISLFTAYAAYLPAEELGVSGVLAAVTIGIYLGWRAPELTTAGTRLQLNSVWQFTSFLLNAVLFMLIGLQLPQVVDSLGGHSLGEAVLYGTLVSAIVICARLLWVLLTPFVLRALDRRQAQVARRSGWRERLVIGWSGMRGAVALAAALALPLETDAGAPFPERDLIIFITFVVILATLVLQGLTLPLLIRRVDISDDGEEEREELRARLGAAKAALERLDELAGEDWTRDDTVQRMRGMYEYRKRRFAARAGKVEDDGYEDRSQAYQRALREVIAAQRQALVRLRNEGAISNDVMNRVQNELDLEDTRLEI